MRASRTGRAGHPRRSRLHDRSLETGRHVGAADGPVSHHSPAAMLEDQDGSVLLRVCPGRRGIEDPARIESEGSPWTSVARCMKSGTGDRTIPVDSLVEPSRLPPEPRSRLRDRGCLAPRAPLPDDVSSWPVGRRPVLSRGRAAGRPGRRRPGLRPRAASCIATSSPPT